MLQCVQPIHFFFNAGNKFRTGHPYGFRDKKQRVQGSAAFSGFELCNIDARQTGEIRKL